MGTECERCVYFDYDEEYDEEVCSLVLDEDELARFYASNEKKCPYFKEYDEYGMVRKQN